MERKFKLQSHYRRNGKFDRNYHVVPKLTLSGKWLNEAGFAPESDVQVECLDNKLIITLL